MLYFVFELVIYFFAIIGVMYLLFSIVDTYTTRASGLRCSIVINEAGSDTEYAVRILEGIITRDELYSFVDNIIIPREAFPDDRTVELLCREFGNIKR